jgi:hypothetical protein
MLLGGKNLVFLILHNLNSFPQRLILSLHGFANGTETSGLPLSLKGLGLFLAHDKHFNK